MTKIIFRTNEELLSFANNNNIKTYTAKNVKTREFPLFGVWVMSLNINASEMTNNRTEISPRFTIKC